MTRGVLMYAHNNPEIDYLKIACANALMVKKNLQVPVALVTDEGTINWGRSAFGDTFIDTCFDKIICVERDYRFDNKRNFSDTSYSTKTLQFYNCNHWEAYELTPFDETLFIDADYLIMSPELSKCWGSNFEVMIDHRICDPGNNGQPHSKYIDDAGIRLFWATVIYFKKSEFAKFMFSLVREIQENYGYYRELYSFANGMYRNDNAFSIAIHTLNGFSQVDSVIGRLPIKSLMMAWDTYDIHSIPDTNSILLYCEITGQPGNYMLSKLKNTDIHIMNKWAVTRHAEKLIELYKE